MTATTNTPRLAALRHRDFRLMWFGDMAAITGAQVQLFAINWHVVQLLANQTATFSLLGQTVTLQNEGLQAFGLGLVGLARVVPIIIFALIGGLLADSRDRRQMLIRARGASLLLAVLLAALTLSGQITLLAVYLLTAAMSAVTAFANPARQSLVPNLVPREHLTNAISLNTLMFQISTISGPALFGLLIARFDLGVSYAVTAVGFVIVIMALLNIEYRGKVISNSGMGWSALVEGLRFTVKTPMIWSTMLLDFFATFFSSAQTMLPLVVTHILKLDASWYGLLGTAQPIGAVLAGTILALRRGIHRQGRVLLWSIGLYGAATALFALSNVFALSYVLYALTGVGDTVSTVIRGTVRQLLTPDALRGRMTSVNMMFFMGGPQLGELEAGIVAALFGVPFSIFSGGVATVLLTAWIAWKYPQLRRYTSSQGVSE
ncbi:MAG: MFS transporter [Chloroflexi bacterium]|nr:MFS transporter [Chloroflexota bacterium]